jgi:thiosulfate dehydrogenase [quinone] large subunit
MNGNNTKYIWATLRILLGWLFFWGFLDKLLGLGFATEPDAAWIRGGSPTFGFLSFGTAGPFAPVFQALAGNPVVDFMFMMALMLIGLALLTGIGVRIAGYSGTALVLMMWLAHLPPADNPLIDEHIVYAALLMGLATVRAGQWVGLGNWLSRVASKTAPALAAVLQ